MSGTNMRSDVGQPILAASSLSSGSRRLNQPDEKRAKPLADARGSETQPLPSRDQRERSWRRLFQHLLKAGGHHQTLYALLTAAAILVWWIPRLFRGFWTDETATYWIASGGIGHVWQRVDMLFPQSLPYCWLSTLFAVSGPYKEAILRLPSIAGMAAAAWLLFRLTERIAGRGSGFLAVVPFACTGVIVETATDARPYALGLAVVLASFLSLYEWVHAPSTRWLLAYCASAPLILYFHYLFGIVFLVQLVYLIAARRAGRRFPLLPILVASALVAAAAIPLLVELPRVVHASAMWKSAETPNAGTFARFYPLQVLAPAMLGLLLYRLLHPEWLDRFSLPRADDSALLFCWLFLGPLALFTASRTGGHAVFVTRYLIYALAPAFILLAWFLERIRNEQARLALVCAIALASVLYVPAIGGSDWRAALDVVRGEAGATTPVLVRSGFVESAFRDLSREPDPAGVLFAPLGIYPLPNPVIAVPFFVDAEAEHRLEAAVQADAPSHPRFCLLADEKADVLDTLPAWLRAHGYRSARRDAGGFAILLFDRTPDLSARAARPAPAHP